jgi:lipid-binding SYLF domain-containing protein
MMKVNLFNSPFGVLHSLFDILRFASEPLCISNSTAKGFQGNGVKENVRKILRSREGRIMRRGIKKATMALLLSFSLLGLWGAPLFAAEENEILQERYRIREVGQDALSALYEIQPSARHAIEHAAGYGVFSIFGIKIFFAGGNTGKGFVHNNWTERYTYMRMVQVQGGLGFGATKDRIIWVFETQKALKDFVNSGWEFGGKAQLAAMVQDTGGMFSGAVSVSPGVHLYQLTETGLSAELTVSGTKYFKDGDLN